MNSKIARLALFGALTVLSFLLAGAVHKNESSVVRLKQAKEITTNLLEDSASICSHSRAHWQNAVKQTPLAFVKIETAATYMAD